MMKFFQIRYDAFLCKLADNVHVACNSMLFLGSADWFAV